MVAPTAPPASKPDAGLPPRLLSTPAVPLPNECRGGSMLCCPADCVCPGAVPARGAGAGFGPTAVAPPPGVRSAPRPAEPCLEPGKDPRPNPTPRSCEPYPCADTRPWGPDIVFTAASEVEGGSCRWPLPSGSRCPPGAGLKPVRGASAAKDCVAPAAAAENALLLLPPGAADRGTAPASNTAGLGSVVLVVAAAAAIWPSPSWLCCEDSSARWLLVFAVLTGMCTTASAAVSPYEFGLNCAAAPIAADS